MSNIDKVLQFVEKSEKLLQLERTEEIEQTSILQESNNKKELERLGVCLLKLHIVSSATGLYGRTVFTFERFRPGAMDKSLPSHKLSPGDIVGLYPGGALGGGSGVTQISSGLVNKVRANQICVAFDENVHDIISKDDRNTFGLLKLANDITYKRLKIVLEDLKVYPSSRPAYRLIEVLFNVTAPCVIETPSIDEFDFINKSLNSSQKSAVVFALSQPEISVIHGPPGTGKTTAVTEVILQAVKRGEKVLVCAPANVAVDNIVEKLTSAKIIRLGHPARVLEDVQKFSLDARLSGSDNSSVIQDVRSDIQKLTVKIRTTKNQSLRHSMRTECKELRKELSRRETASLKEVLSSADVVLSTLTGCSPDGPVRYLPPGHFDLVVIDECSQAIEPACWIAMLNAHRCVLAGDYKQLPPTILSQKAAVAGLSVSLMERVIQQHGEHIVKMLNVQYRMNEVIMNWPSRQLYNACLIADESVKDHLLSDLEGIVCTDDTGIPLLLIDTAGCDMHELPSDENSSKGNQYETEIVTQHVQALLAANVPAKDIAVIAPYNLQVEMLRQCLQSDNPMLEVKSVDGFQGREKEAVVITLVRSNQGGEIGFLSENRRINVAITRARRHLAIIGDTETLSNDGFLKSLFEYIYDIGVVYNATTYTDISVKHSTDNTASARVYTQQNTTHTREDNYKMKRQRCKIPFPDPSSRIDIKTDDQYLIDDILSFLNEKGLTDMVFPESLSSRGRKIVHQVAEDHGLYHRSHGDGVMRKVTISKTPMDPIAETISQNSAPGKPNGSIESTEERTKNEPADDVSIVKVTSEIGTETETETETETQTVYPAPEVSDELFQRVDAIPSRSSAPGERDRNRDADGLKTKACEIETESERRPDKSAGVSGTPCEICGKTIPKSNMDLHRLHCQWMKERTERTNLLPPEKTVGKSQPGGWKQGRESPAVKPKPFGKDPGVKKKTKNNPSARGAARGVSFDGLDPDGNDDDFDTIMRALAESNARCGFGSCRTRVSTVGQICEYCRQKHCLEHQLPEVHGCGEQAHAEARRRVKKDGVIRPGSGKVNKKPNATKKAQLKIQLDKKLSELSDQRHKKNKEPDSRHS